MCVSQCVFISLSACVTLSVCVSLSLSVCFSSWKWVSLLACVSLSICWWISIWLLSSLSLPSPNPYQSWYSSIGSPYKEPVLYISDRKRNQLVSRNLPSGFQLDTFRGWGTLSDITWLDPLQEAFPQQLLDDNLASASIYQIMLCSLFGCFLLSSSLRTNCSNFLLFWNLIFLLSSPIFWRNIILSYETVLLFEKCFSKVFFFFGMLIILLSLFLTWHNYKLWSPVYFPEWNTILLSVLEYCIHRILYFRSM